MKTEILRVKNLCKSFKNITILENVHFHLYKGEVIGIMGLHNSGKTVLCNILLGNETFCKGSIYFEEEPFNISLLIQNNYICMIHKNSSLIDTLTIMENIFVIRKTQKKFVRRKMIRSELEYWLSEFNIHIAPTELAGRLTRVQRYIIEILKGFIFGAKIIIINDISFENKPNEYDELYQIIEKLKLRGISFIITSYQIKILQLYSERIYFLSNGSMVKSITNTMRKQIDVENILINKDKVTTNPKINNRIHSDETVLRLKNISNDFFKNITIDLKKGEVLVIFDLLKNSNEKLWQLLNDRNHIFDGSIVYKDKDLEATRNTYQKDVIFADFDMNNNIYEYLSVSGNICISNYKRLSTLGYISKRRVRFIEKEFTQWYGDNELIQRAYCTNLSEKEKIAIYMYRLRLQAGNVMFCKNPEQVADYVTLQLIERELCHMADQGKAICILTSNIEHLSHFADRIIILSEGKIEGNYNSNQFLDNRLSSTE